MTTAAERSRTSVLRSAIISTFVAGPFAGLLIATAIIGGYPTPENDDTPSAMLLIWGVVMGFFYASLPAAVFGASVGQYVRRRVVQGTDQHSLRFHAMAAGATLGGLFGAVLYWFGGVPIPIPLSLLSIAGAGSGAVCGAMVTAIVSSDQRADVRAAEQ